MMDKMRAASKSWVAAILIGFLILSFAIWGINDIFSSRSTTTLVKIGDNELDYRTFEQEFTNKARNQIDAAGRPMTVQEAREAIARYDARQRGGELDESLDVIEARFADAETTGRLVQAVRSTVGANRQKAEAALPRAA